jgi:glycosyltransferase involved in cell wall biosynthesis
MDILGGIAAWMTKTPWVLREPSSAAAYSPSAKNRLRQWIGARASAILPNSKGGESYWKALGNSPVCHVIPNGIPMEQLDIVGQAPLSDFDIPSGRQVILYVGRFDKGKNIENMLAALSIIQNEESITAVLAGDGPLKQVIRQTINRLGISDQVILPGFVSNPWALMKRADAFVFVSEFEGFPNVVIEAMACSCPLVVSDIPAHREFLDEQCALLVNPGCPEKISEALQGVLSDTTGARARAKIAYEKVAQWSIDSVANRVEGVYRDVLDFRR